MARYGHIAYNSKTQVLITPEEVAQSINY
jgi:hypothetical protein